MLLDLERNRYFGIGAQETRALSTLALNWDEAQANAAEVEKLPPAAAASMADALLEAGLLSREAAVAAPIGTAPIDLNGVLSSVGHELDRPASLQLAHIRSFFAALLWTRRALRSRTLYSIACEVRDSKARAPRAFDEEHTVELIGIFRRMRPYTFAAKDRCLFHALALVKFLSRHEVFPTWVIGVRAKPWGAHSWVQHGKLLLDANPEQVCEYTPILTV